MRARHANLSTVSQAPAAFHLLAKPTGAVCNLDCTYCFFLSKEMLYPGSRFRMADELLETYLRQLIDAHAASPVVEIAWQGGEPTLMGLEFFRRSVELVDRHLQPGQRPLYTIQTNGTKLDDSWVSFFKEHEFLVGISIDGPREIHDTYRLTRGGRGSFDQVMRGLGHLRAGGVDFNVLTTVHDANENRGVEVYRFLRDECGARFLQFIPVIERLTPSGGASDPSWSSWRDRPLYTQNGTEVTSRSVSPEGYGRFLIDIFEEWVRRDIGEVYVQMFDAPSPTGSTSSRACACTARPAGSRWRSSTRATFTRAITSSNRATYSATSPNTRWPSSSPHSASSDSVWTSATRYPATAGNARSVSPATAAVPRTASRGPRTATPASTTYAPASSCSSATSRNLCGS